MGYFTIPLAKIVGARGRVTAIDLQAKMLSSLSSRAKRNGVSDRIQACQAEPESLGTHDPVDFILAFWMVHEVPDQRRMLAEIRDLLKPEGRFLLVEPKIHVTRKNFESTLRIAAEVGFIVRENPRIRLSRSVVLGLNRR
jgi:ubiquinone/menaquinone biosynthesis C-methylase UbiE